jgi:hypothetical protein
MKAFFETVWYFILKYWVPIVILAIGIVQMFVGKWLIIAIMVIVACVIAIVESVKN